MPATSASRCSSCCSAQDPAADRGIESGSTPWEWLGSCSRTCSVTLRPLADAPLSSRRSGPALM
eukprot:16438793-Heterocapsa_arctica.AAC.1